MLSPASSAHQVFSKLNIGDPVRSVTRVMAAGACCHIPVFRSKFLSVEKEAASVNEERRKPGGQSAGLKEDCRSRLK